jgi:hypothetical protein
LDLNGIFESQEKAATENFKRSRTLREVFSFISKALDQSTSFLATAPFSSPEKATSIRMLAADCISHVAIAMRLALWGAVPQSVAILRGALEGCSVLELMVSQQQYRTFVYECNHSFRQLDFKSATNSLGSLGKNIEKLWGGMSELGPHASAGRIRESVYHFEGQSYDRLGGAMDAGGAETCAYYVMHPTRVIIESLHKAAEQDGIAFPEAAIHSEMLNEFSALCKKFEENLSSSASEDDCGNSNS